MSLGEIVAVVKEAINALTERQQSQSDVFTWEEPAVVFLLSALEEALAFGINEQAGGAGSILKRNRVLYWHYLQCISETIPGGQNVINTITKLPHAQSPANAGRIFICNALNEKELGNYLSSLSFHPALTTTFYQTNSIIASEIHRDTLLSLVESLSSFHFDLSLYNKLLRDETAFSSSRVHTKQQMELQILSSQPQQHKTVEDYIESTNIPENEFWQQMPNSSALLVEHQGKKKKKKSKNKKIRQFSENIKTDQHVEDLDNENKEISQTQHENQEEESNKTKEDSEDENYIKNTEIKHKETEPEIVGYSNHSYVQLCTSYETLSFAEQLICSILSKDEQVVLPPVLENRISFDFEPTPIPKESPSESDSEDILSHESNFWSPLSNSDNVKSVSEATEVKKVPSDSLTEERQILPAKKKRSLSSLLASKPAPVREGEATNERRDETQVERNPNSLVLVLTISSKSQATIKNCFNCKVMISKSGFGSSARFCEYFGEYFCKQCHTNQESILPGHIVQQWDFGRYKISDLGFKTLRNAIDAPIIPVPKTLYQLSRRMARNKELRKALAKMESFINTCEQREKLLKLIGINQHLFVDNDVFTLRNLIETKQDKFMIFMGNLCKKYSEHIHSCQICYSKGTRCPLCSSGKPVFPFEIKKTKVCLRCKQVYHRECFRKIGKCPNCC